MTTTAESQFDRSPTVLLGVPIAGRWVRLERFRPDHVPALYALVSEDGSPTRWPLGSQRVDEAGLADHLLSLNGVQFVLIQSESDRVVGIVQGMHLDRRNGTVDIGVVLGADGWRSGWPLEGIVIFIDYLVEGMGMRKLYFEMSKSTMDNVGGALKHWLVPECVFRSHVQSPTGNYEDVHVMALYGDCWDTGLVRRLTRNVPINRVDSDGRDL